MSENRYEARDRSKLERRKQWHEDVELRQNEEIDRREHEQRKRLEERHLIEVEA